MILNFKIIDRTAIFLLFSSNFNTVLINNQIEDLEREAEMMLDESIAEFGSKRAFSRLKYALII